MTGEATMAGNPAPGFRDRPEKQINTAPFKGSVVVKVGDAVIARSRDAVRLEEAPYPAAFYIPFADIDFNRLEPTATTSYCPFKGEASYWGTSSEAGAVPDVMWAYRTPYDEMAVIRDHGAFYPNKATIEATPN